MWGTMMKWTKTSGTELMCLLLYLLAHHDVQMVCTTECCHHFMILVRFLCPVMCSI